MVVRFLLRLLPMIINFLPARLTEFFTKSKVSGWHLNIFLSSLITVFFFFHLTPYTQNKMLIFGAEIPSACLFKNVIGIHCPACGLSHSIHSMLHLDIGKSFHYHTCGPIIVIVILMVMLYQMLAFVKIVNRISFENEVYLAKKLDLAIICLLITSWLIKNATF